MGGLVFVEAGCLLDTWRMATRLVRTVRCVGDAIDVIEAESARGTDPVAVHQMLWALLHGVSLTTVTPSCIDRIDALGRTAARVVRQHRRAGDTIVVVADLLPVFAPAAQAHLRVDRVVCGIPPVGPDGCLTGGFPGILLGAAARAAAESVARHESVAPADCTTYARAPRDQQLLTVGHGIRLDYAGKLHDVCPHPHVDPARKAAS